MINYCLAWKNFKFFPRRIVSIIRLRKPQKGKQPKNKKKVQSDGDDQLKKKEREKATYVNSINPMAKKTHLKGSA